MAWVETRITRTTQPQDAVGVDWNNPLTRGLTRAVKGNGSKEEVSSAFNQNNGTVYTSVMGVGFGTNSGSSITFPDTPVSLYTIFSLAQAYTAAEVALLTRTAGAAAYNQNFALSLAGGVTPKAGHKNVSGNAYPYVTSSISVAPNTLVAAASVYNGSSIKVFTNGALGGSIAATDPYTSFAGSVTQIGAVDGTARTANYRGGGIWLSLIFNRALSDAEIKSLSDNPWQIFEPEVSRVWVESATEAAPPGDPTGILSATETGSDTAVLSGQIVVQGTLAATEQGSDTPTLTGKVLVQGSLAATEVGSDTALINGSSVIITSGTLNATETGGDSASMASKVLVTGAVSGQELGSDTASLAGAAAVTGVRYWNGATWAYGTLRYWNGSMWGTGTLRYWNGTNWSIP